ncbi:MAG: ATP-binding protein [Actinomycetota bacterium]|nr:ATP-binding protein [Actinomycetota bacterium]
MTTEFFGRELELVVLHECLEAALEGHTRLVLCQGRPGIGKTRLTEELMARAASRGMRGVWGVGGDSPGAPPFWPWRQILRGVSDDIDLGSMADELGLTVDLARLAPDVFTAPRGTGDDPVTTEDRFRQFDAVAALLRQVSRRSPLLIAFDDAQVVDHPSLLLLRHVARSVKEDRLLMVVNHRDSDQTNGPLLAELLREPVTRLVGLRGLDPPAVARQLASVIGHEVADREVAEVHATTGGNPFFVAEVGRMLAGRQAGAPASPVTAASVRQSALG